MRFSHLRGPMALLRKSKGRLPKLTRAQSVEAVPMLNRLMTVERTDEGNAILNLPRRRTSVVRLMSKLFRLPPYKRIELDEPGTYTVELCDGSRSVGQIISLFAERFKLNRREAEVLIQAYLGSLAKRSIIGFAITKDVRQ